jgi:ssRNA-specific RNase YbeY (16S rRNA maturation enzyme)
MTCEKDNNSDNNSVNKIIYQLQPANKTYIEYTVILLSETEMNKSNNREYRNDYFYYTFPANWKKSILIVRP